MVHTYVVRGARGASALASTSSRRASRSLPLKIHNELWRGCRQLPAAVANWAREIARQWFGAKKDTSWVVRPSFTTDAGVSLRPRAEINLVCAGIQRAAGVPAARTHSHFTRCEEAARAPKLRRRALGTAQTTVLAHESGVETRGPLAAVLVEQD